jgi:hypothetical protein
MFALYLLIATSTVICATSFDDYDDVHRLNCNWAQTYDDLDLLIDCAEIQDEVMLLASHWDGRFASVGRSSFSESMTMNLVIDFVTGDKVSTVSILRLKFTLRGW